MAQTTLLSLVCSKLPRCISVNDFTAYINRSLLKTMPDRAIIGALRRCPLIDWQAYLENNQDIKSSNVDPVDHFINFGIFEDRKLYCQRTECASEKIQNAPKISIIIPNYNNAIYLKRCLSSLQGQSLQDIEVILVDDASTDDSKYIINSFIREDSRIKLIEFKVNCGTHMARKKGVQNAQGRFIMFLDPDDYYAPNACEIAYNAIIKGYDIVCFGAYIVNNGFKSDKEVQGCNDFINKTQNALYIGDEIIESVYIKREIGYTIWNKIYNSSVCKAGFDEMEDGYYAGPEDSYEFLVISSKAKNLLKISDKLYYYNYGVGISFADESSEKIQFFIDRGSIINPIRNYCYKNNLKSYLNIIKTRLFHHGFTQSFVVMPSQYVQIFFESLIKQYGILFTVQQIFNEYINNWSRIAKKFMFYNINHVKSIKKIGIYYTRISHGGVENTMSNTIDVLLSAGYEIDLFIEHKSEHDMPINKKVDIYYLHPSYYTRTDIKLHLHDLYETVQESNIDCMLYMWSSEPSLLWDIMLLKFMNIPVICNLRYDYAYDFSRNRPHYPAIAQLNALKCADKVICLSRYSEMFLRMNGVDAAYIPNGIRNERFIDPCKNDNNTICFIARLDDKIKRPEHALKILHEILKYYPGIRCIFIGDFDKSERRKEFFEYAKQLNLMDNIKITGWCDNPEIYLSRCSILVVTSYTESFHNGILEAQACGLPVVTYDLPIMQIENNESIIVVPQEDYRMASKKIIELLINLNQLERLRKIAAEKAMRFSISIFKYNLIDTITTFQNQSRLKLYTATDYTKTINWLTFYRGGESYS